MADEFQTGNPDVQQAVTAALEEQKKKKKKKRLIILGVILALIVVIGVASSGSGDKGSSDTAAAGTDAAGQTTKAAVAASNSENNVGKYKVELKNSRITKDYEGKKILVVTYNFKNNDSEAKSFDVAVEAKAYQNGVELGDVWSSYGIDGYSFDEQHKEVKPGVALDVQCAYELNDDATDVTIELSQWLSDNVQQTYTIKIK